MYVAKSIERPKSMHKPIQLESLAKDWQQPKVMLHWPSQAALIVSLFIGSSGSARKRKNSGITTVRAALVKARSST